MLENNFKDYLNSRKDNIKYLGYNYKNNIFKNTLSSAFFIENKRENILSEIERLIYFTIEYVKNIKKSYNYTYPKNFNKFN